MNICDLFSAEQRKSVDDIEVFFNKQQQSFDRVKTLDTSAPEHVRYL